EELGRQASSRDSGPISSVADMLNWEGTSEAREGNVMMIRIGIALAVAVACIMYTAFSHAVQAQTARRSVTVKHPPGGQSGRHFGFLVRAAEHHRQQALRADAADKSRLSEGPHAKGMRRHHFSGAP